MNPSYPNSRGNSGFNFLFIYHFPVSNKKERGLKCNMVVFVLDDNGNYIAEERYTERVMNHNREILTNFINTKRLEGCSSQTLKNYEDCIWGLSLGIGKEYDKLTVNDIKSFLSNYQAMRKIKNHSMDNMRRVYSSFYNFLEEEDYVLKSPMRKIHKIKSEKVIQKPFTDEEVVLIQDNCKNIRELAIIDFLNSTGVRVSELCALDREDIDLEKREGLVFGKGSKERIIYFDARTKVHLQKYLERREDDNIALFTTNKAPYDRLTKTGIEYIVAKIGLRSSIEKCHPHRFRRTLATRLIDRGVPIEQVQCILGHTKLDTTLIYAQVNQGNVKNNHSKFA